MGFTANVVDGNIILASWGNEIRDRTVQVFATAAERDQQWAAPPTGAVCITVDNGFIWKRSAGRWAPVYGTVVLNQTFAVPDGGYTTTGLRDLVVCGPATPFTYNTNVSFVAAINFGFSGGACTAQTDFVTNGGTSLHPTSGPFQAGGGLWVPVPMAGNASIAAGTDARIKPRINVSNTGGGMVHTGGNVLVTYYAANA